MFKFGKNKTSDKDEDGVEPNLIINDISIFKLILIILVISYVGLHTIAGLIY